MSKVDNQSDEKIAGSVQAGDVELFEFLVLRYENKMTRYARRFLSNEMDIEDAVQSVFLKAYENIKSFDVKRKFSTWLYRIAHNEFINVLKKNKKAPLSFFELDTFLPHKVGKSDIHRNVLNKEVREALDKCLGRLDSKYKEALILYYFEEMSYQEISEIMRIPVSTVGIRLKRGREALNNVYKELGYGQ